MKKILISIAIIGLTFVASFAQNSNAITINPEESIDSVAQTREVYCMILGHATNLFGMGSKCVVEVDFGDGKEIWTGGMDNTLVDENGKAIKFNSMIDAMNYLSKFGWTFLDAYAITVGPNNHVYHWLMRKLVSTDESGREGITQRRDTKKKKDKKPAVYDKFDNIY